MRLKPTVLAALPSDGSFTNAFSAHVETTSLPCMSPRRRYSNSEAIWQTSTLSPPGQISVLARSHLSTNDLKRSLYDHDQKILAPACRDRGYWMVPHDDLAKGEGRRPSGADPHRAQYHCVGRRGDRPVAAAMHRHEPKKCLMVSRDVIQLHPMSRNWGGKWGGIFPETKKANLTIGLSP